MRKLLSIVYLFSSISSIQGCAVRSLPVSQLEKDSFFAPAKDKNQSTLFLTCGKNLTDGNPDNPMMLKEAAFCGFEINGKKYSELAKGQVARLDIPSGKFTVNNSSGLDMTKTISIDSGQAFLLVSDTNFLVNNKAMAFGVVGVAAASISEAVEPDPRNINNPLIVYKSEKDFMPIIRSKEMVRLTSVNK